MPTKKTKFQRGVLALAKAMEQGIKKTQPGFGAYLSLSIAGKPQACALGAAYVAGHAERVQNVGISWHDVEKVLPVISTPCADSGLSLGRHIIDLNDLGEWSRKRIVKWLKQVAKLPCRPARWEDVKEAK